MQMFFIYPAILHILFVSMQCFDSLDIDEEIETPLSRMLIVPEIECESLTYTRIYWAALVPAIVVYMVIIPVATIHKLVLNSHWIYHSGRDRSKLDQEEFSNSVRTKSSYGFFYAGLSISRLLGRPLEDDDFPIENVGTYSDENLRSDWKVCCQSIRESILIYLYHPISGKGALVRISPKHVSKSYFYWEFIVFIEKFILILLATRFGQKM